MQCNKQAYILAYHESHMQWQLITPTFLTLQASHNGGHGEIQLRILALP